MPTRLSFRTLMTIMSSAFPNGRRPGASDKGSPPAFRRGDKVMVTWSVDARGQDLEIIAVADGVIARRYRDGFIVRTDHGLAYVPGGNLRALACDPKNGESVAGGTIGV